jgi:hypothetical protein
VITLLQLSYQKFNALIISPKHATYPANLIPLKYYIHTCAHAYNVTLIYDRQTSSREMLDGKDCHRRHYESYGVVGSSLRRYPGISLEGLRKAMKYRSQNRWPSGRNLNRGPPEYETEMVFTVDLVGTASYSLFRFRSKNTERIRICDLSGRGSSQTSAWTSTSLSEVFMVVIVSWNRPHPPPSVFLSTHYRLMNLPFGPIYFEQRASWPRRLWHELPSLELWDCGFESNSRNGCLCAFILCLWCSV